jgi:hypothetical protein
MNTHSGSRNQEEDLLMQGILCCVLGALCANCCGVFCICFGGFKFLQHVNKDCPQEGGGCLIVIKVFFVLMVILVVIVPIVCISIFVVFFVVVLVFGVNATKVD